MISEKGRAFVLIFPAHTIELISEHDIVERASEWLALVWVCMDGTFTLGAKSSATTLTVIMLLITS